MADAKKTAKSNTENKYYTLDEINKLDADWNIVVSGRSDGKTYAVLSEILKNYVNSGYVKQGAYLRRRAVDFSSLNNDQLFAGIVQNGLVNELTGGKWNDVHYNSRRWYLSRINEEGERENDENPFCFAFALSEMEHNKSISLPSITIIAYDEFLTRSLELKNEWAILLNVLSTIIRDRDDVKIYMLANTVSYYSTYWDNFGINIQDIPINTIRLYKMGKNEELSFAVEYYNSANRKKDSEKYFCFDDPHVSMITKALWETDLYPHLPKVWNEKKEMDEFIELEDNDVDFSFFVKYKNDLVQCDWIDKGDWNFIFVHKKTTPIKYIDDDIVFSLEATPRANWIPNLMKSKSLISKAVYDMIIEGKVFFQDNVCGETFSKYLESCVSTSLITG